MKKIIITSFFLVSVFLAYSQGRASYMDSLFLFNEIKLTDEHIKESGMDSLDDWHLKNLILARLANGKRVEFNVALSNIYSFIANDRDAKKDNCKQSIDYLNKLFEMPKLKKDEYIELLKVKFHIYNNIIKYNDYSKKCSVLIDFYDEYIPIITDKKSEYELACSRSSFDKGLSYKYLGQDEQAIKVLDNIRRPRFWDVEGKYRDEVINYDEFACLEILNIRRGDLQALEGIPFYEHYSKDVKFMHKQYIEELGGVYPPLSITQPEPIIKIKGKRN